MNALSSLNREDAYSAVEPYINAEGVHLWPFDPLFPVDVHFFTLDGPGNIRMNRHDYFELGLVLSGEAVFQIQERSLPVREGDMLVMGSNLYHTLRKLPRRKFEAVFFFFEPGLVRAAESSGDDLEYLLPFSLQDADFPHIIPPETGIPAQSLDLIQRIWSELPAESNLARLTVRTYIKTILISLANHYATYRDTREKFRQKEEAFERLRPLFDFVDRHYQQPITVKDAARLSAMSASSFERFFKSTAGQSFHAWLNHLRIAKAQALLASTEKPLAEISQETGFCDQSYFGRVFREIANTTPAAYRRRFGQASLAGSSQCEDREH